METFYHIDKEKIKGKIKEEKLRIFIIQKKSV